MLQVPVSVVEFAPPSLALPACVTVYWLRSCGPRITLQHLQALVLGMVYGEVCRLKVSQRGDAAVIAVGISTTITVAMEVTMEIAIGVTVGKFIS